MKLLRRHAAVSAAALLLVILLTVVLLARFTSAAERLAYWPSRDSFITPPGIEDVTFTTPDGTRLHAWFLPAPGASPDNPAPAVLHCHGNAGNLSHHADFSNFLPPAGVSVLLFDYRGYGRSDNKTIRRRALLQDTNAALDTLLARPDVDSDRVGVLGVSLGGAFALPLAAQRQEIRCIVTLSTFSAWKAVAKDMLPFLGPLIMPRGLDPIDAIANLNDTPWLIVHGTDDKIIDHRHAIILHDAATSAGTNATLRTVDGADHNYLLESDPEVMDEIARFFLDNLAP